MRRSRTEETVEVPKRTSLTVAEGVLRYEAGERTAGVRTPPGNDKEAGAAVPGTAGAEVVAGVRREKTKVSLVRETERKDETGMTTNGQVDLGQMREGKGTHDLHLAPVMTKVKI